VFGVGGRRRDGSAGNAALAAFICSSPRRVYLANRQNSVNQNSPRVFSDPQGYVCRIRNLPARRPT